MPIEAYYDTADYHSHFSTKLFGAYNKAIETSNVRTRRIEIVGTEMFLSQQT